MQATGNDFLIVDGQANGDQSNLAKRYCDRHYGFGADGWIRLKSSGKKYSWDFFNSDGSPAKMCGNAARAVGMYLLDKNETTVETFETAIGPVQARRDGKEIQVEFRMPTVTPKQLDLYSATFVDTGVPHAVIRIESLGDRNKLIQMALEIKKTFLSTGINVTFYVEAKSDSINAITFERGVEDFTLSCGTGALAAARVFLGSRSSHCAVEVPGGILRIEFNGDLARLTGPAEYVGWCEDYRKDSL